MLSSTVSVTLALARSRPSVKQRGPAGQHLVGWRRATTITSAPGTAAAASTPSCAITATPRLQPAGPNAEHALMLRTDRAGSADIVHTREPGI